ncbi:protein EMSY-LIKE 3-like [Solanum pennellii]|uniref:Protein EMSY-LIKE 3-like n=1 Tax=Solanum pennellii TaxID=28526 RepID=A0ABM1H0Q7_SOLPN|nr:protein EMSY-LIKE 3-like [Solanum pennellii]
MAYDNTGTDEDLPQSHWSRMPRGGVFGTGDDRAAMMYDETDMEVEIHRLEQEAYSSVLRAFKAQADTITWEKESLISELRKELRLSSDHHREFLGRVNEDDVVRRIREWRISCMRGTGQAVHDQIPSSFVRANQIIAPYLPSRSFSGPSPSFRPPAASAANQPSTSTANRDPMMDPKDQIYSTKMQYLSLGPSGRGQSSNQVSEPAEPVSFDPLIGRKVRTRRPDDNNFYEAVIADCNAAEGKHVLVYDGGSANEMSEWVNLKEIPPEDIQWEGEDPGISHHGNNSQSGRGRDSDPVAVRGLGLTMPQSRTDFPSSHYGIGKKGDDFIVLLRTDMLINEVEKRVFGTSHPDPLEVEKAKEVLKDHEQALVAAISRLDRMISDGDSSMNCAK